MPLSAAVEITNRTPKTAKQLEDLRERYRKAHGRELPNSVERAMGAEKRGNA